jgi:hypothetical protein
MGEELPGDHQPRDRVALRFLTGTEGQKQEKDTEEEAPAIEFPLRPSGFACLSPTNQWGQDITNSVYFASLLNATV